MSDKLKKSVRTKAHKHAHKTVKHLPSSRVRKAKAHLADDGYMIGVVKNGHFHTRDTVYNGVSYSSLTGHAPKYRPIPMSKMRGHYKARIEYLS